jgi:hypothetical protein
VTRSDVEADDVVGGWMLGRQRKVSEETRRVV